MSRYGWQGTERNSINIDAKSSRSSAARQSRGRLRRAHSSPRKMYRIVFLPNDRLFSREKGGCCSFQIGFLDPSKLPITGAAFSSPVGINP
jgi:hypothetical protein